MLDSWWWTEILSQICEFYSKNKFEKLVHLVGFIIRIYHDARSSEYQNHDLSFVICGLLYSKVGWLVGVVKSYCYHYDACFVSSDIVKCVVPRSILDRTIVQLSVRRAFIVTVIVCGCSWLVKTHSGAVSYVTVCSVNSVPVHCPSAVLSFNLELYKPYFCVSWNLPYQV